MDYYIHLAILVCIYLILAQSFNIIFGLGRLLNLAHIAVYAIGAYTTALMSTELGSGFIVCVICSMILSAFFALLIGAISLRLSQDYFAIGTLAFSSVVTAVLINWKSVTRGVLGIPGIPRPEMFGVDFYKNSNFLVLIACAVIIVQAFLYLVFHSRLARSLRAQAENEFAAQAVGKHLTAVRNDGFIMSSMFAGLAGSFYAYYINFIDPSSFNLQEMVFVLSIVVIGRPGSFWGVIAGTCFLVLLPEPLRFLDIPDEYVGPMRQLIYAMILFSVVYWKRACLFPVERSI